MLLSWSDAPPTQESPPSTFEVAGATYDVGVRTVTDAASATRLTCKASRDNPVPAHELVSISRRA